MIECRVCHITKDETEFFRAAQREYVDKICKSCKADRIRLRRTKNKEILVELKGGCCSRCGYSRCLKALQFHHTDPSKKDPYYRNGGDLTVVHVDRAVKELDGCILVCANCHVEIHEELGIE